MPKKERLDILLVQRGLVETRSLAQRLVMAGQVRVSGQVELKPGTSVPTGADLSIDQRPRYVSRGGEKLEAALQAFPISPIGRICADVGSSTGGFTDCLLQNGAVKVYAIDVGQGILDWKLRQDSRVVVMEETNARAVERLPEPISLITIDASFISLKIILPVVRGWFGDQSSGDVISLVKPQFEAGKKEVARGKGVIRDPAIHRQVLFDILTYAQEIGFTVHDVIRSPLFGPKGNTEFLAWLSYPPSEKTALENNITQILHRLFE